VRLGILGEIFVSAPWISCPGRQARHPATPLPSIPGAWRRACRANPQSRRRSIRPSPDRFDVERHVNKTARRHIKGIPRREIEARGVQRAIKTRPGNVVTRRTLTRTTFFQIGFQPLQKLQEGVARERALAVALASFI
jgi:hypothetical protein